MQHLYIMKGEKKLNCRLSQFSNFADTAVLYSRQYASEPKENLKTCSYKLYAWLHYEDTELYVKSLTRIY